MVELTATVKNRISYTKKVSTTELYSINKAVSMIVDDIRSIKLTTEG